MPYDSRTYRVLIASPSDVEEEREIAVRVIQEWNDLYSYTRKVVLLPLRWETHTAPEYGTRPQEVINRTIVDNCDLLVGVFWTRIGTPTGVADSGTLEEIERVAKAGKPVMLYFSKVGMDPDRIDLTQLARLQDFKQHTYPNALTESFKSQIEFRDKFAKQLELKVRELQKVDDTRQPPPLSLGFPLNPNSVSPLVQKSIELLEPTDLATVLSADSPGERGAIEKLVHERLRELSTLPVILAIQNSGSSGIRNLYVEMSIESKSNVEVSDSRRAWTFWFDTAESEKTEVLRKTSTGWVFTFEWDALQPQRIRLVKQRLGIKTTGNAEINFTAKVFADSFAEPILLKSQLDLIFKVKKCLTAEAIPDMDALRKEVAKSKEKSTSTTAVGA